jgi:plasmid rolling circle replication initiator protein Rep
LEFTNEVLQKMEDKQKYNKDISGYFYKLYLDEKTTRKGNNKYINISENVRNCLSCWVWDEYKKNLVLDLQKVNRCKNRFCSNCRKFDLSRALNNLSPHFRDLIDDGYVPLLLTLTVPNCLGCELNDTLDKMQKAFKKFWNWFARDDTKCYKGRFVKFYGAVRCIEVNYSKRRGDYHPHYHILIFIKYYDYLSVEGYFKKLYQGEYSENRKSFNMYSDFDMQVRKLWTIAYNDFTLVVYDELDQYSSYKCDIKEMDCNGVYEVMKYVFKDTDIENYYVFRDFYYGLYGRRVRQGYGLLYNLKLEDDSDGKKQDLNLEIEESSNRLVTTEIRTLYNSYSHYIKISRFNKYSEMKNLQ